MKPLVVALIMFCAIGQTSFGQEGSKDPYFEELVNMLASRTTPLVSMQEKAVNRLGDRAAIGLVRHLGVHTPSTSQEVEGVLFVIRMAFASPQTISSDADREPKATLVLLAYLNFLPASKDLKTEIEHTRVYVVRQIDAYQRKHAGETH